MTLCRKSPAESVILISHQMWAATYPERWYRDKRNCVVLVLQHSVARQVSIITWLYQCSVVTPARRNVSWPGEDARQECTKPAPCRSHTTEEATQGPWLLFSCLKFLLSRGGILGSKGVYNFLLPAGPGNCKSSIKTFWNLPFQENTSQLSSQVWILSY